MQSVLTWTQSTYGICFWPLFKPFTLEFLLFSSQSLPQRTGFLSLFCKTLSSRPVRQSYMAVTERRHNVITHLQSNAIQHNSTARKKRKKNTLLGKLTCSKQDKMAQTKQCNQLKSQYEKNIFYLLLGCLIQIAHIFII